MRDNILHPEQYGFVRGKSTCTNLLESLNDWTRNIQYGFPTVVIYIDFRSSAKLLTLYSMTSYLLNFGLVLVVCCLNGLRIYSM